MKLPWRTRSWISFLLSASVLVGSHVAAQETPSPFVIGETLELESHALGETRRLIVGKPRGYETSNVRYPVIYLLDGGGHFHHTTGITSFLAANARTPDVLVIAITNTDRTRDLTPPSQVEEDIERMPTQGGAATFLSFISQELMPWVDRNYRTLPHRVLVGHSFGGLFAIHTLITEPTVFDAYIAVSPSLQWNDQRLVAEAEAFFDRTPELDARLFMTVGNEGGALLGGVRKLAGILDEKAPRGFEWQFDLMAEQSHGSVPHLSTYAGLEFVFPDYYLADPLTEFDRTGLQGIRAFYSRSGEALGYDRRIPLDTLGELVGRLLEDDRLDEAMMLVSQEPQTYSPPLPQQLLHQAWTRIAGRYARTGNEAQAIEVYRRLLDADSENALARSALIELGVDPAELP